ncbi:MAG: PEGA domain-containing protein, partial [Candidatus Cryptobacteroides sp.]
RLLTGQTPPDADVINDDGFPDNPGYVSGTVWKAIEAAMQPRRKDRPQSIADFLKILDRNTDAGTDEDKTTFEDDETHIDDDKTGFEEDSTQYTTRLDVDTTPHDADVILDGKSLGVTPIKGYEVTIGQHELRIEKSGYEPHNTRMTFGSEPVRINETLKKEAAPRPKPSWLKWAVSAAACLLIVVVLIAFLRNDNVEISQATGTIDGYEYVDLGLSVKWATCNVGASSPSDYGNYYAWGEVRTKSEYTYENSTTYEKSMRDISGNSTYDAARYNWGGKWRLPTKAECQELVDNCTWTWASQGGHNGYKVTSKKNGASIFLPAAGYRYGSSLYDAGEYGDYWSSSPLEGNTQRAYYLYFDSGLHDVGWYYRNYGRSVRPVSE